MQSLNERFQPTSSEEHIYIVDAPKPEELKDVCQISFPDLRHAIVLCVKGVKEKYVTQKFEEFDSFNLELMHPSFAINFLSTPKMIEIQQFSVYCGSLVKQSECIIHKEIDFEDLGMVPHRPIDNLCMNLTQPYCRVAVGKSTVKIAGKEGDKIFVVGTLPPRLTLEEMREFDVEELQSFYIIEEVEAKTLKTFLSHPDVSNMESLMAALEASQIPLQTLLSRLSMPVLPDRYGPWQEDLWLSLMLAVRSKDWNNAIRIYSRVEPDGIPNICSSLLCQIFADVRKKLEERDHEMVAHGKRPLPNVPDSDLALKRDHAFNNDPLQRHASAIQRQ